ncbi:iron(III) transport system substrate-binding protein [Nocardioides aromaticivorans]|uniref:Iron(III) transport system substrate-binding protein n=1 Tax=Nocardioides aromaticivorans TaxID=200618 RepID=A0A7Y9ZKR9_9ACTN|nr:extracellular solute-binding protein [Nocardioides aromaticivorans]NYI45311.1 iron(III) transport system substrate-binding protein [Nocardioides aromaticivorans]
MTSKRLAAALAGGLFSVAALAGCGSDSGGGELAGSWDGIVEAAKKEGEVVIYGTVAPDNLELLKKAFEKKYPDIELTYVRGTDADLLPKVEIENQTGRGTADVHMTTDAGWIDRSADGGYSVDIVGPSFDNEDYDRSNSVIDDQWFLTSATVFGLGWNTQKLPNGVTSPEDLLAANLKGGKLGVTNPAGIPTYVDMYRTIDEDFGTDYVDRLAAMDPRVYDSAVAIGQAIASGEIWASPTIGSTILTEKANGAPVEFIIPEKPFGVPWYSHVLSSSPHPNAAQVLADFLVTPEGQAAISHDFVPALPDIEGTGVAGSDLLAQEIPLGDPDELSGDSVAAYQEEWEKQFLD